MTNWATDWAGVPERFADAMVAWDRQAIDDVKINRICWVDYTTRCPIWVVDITKMTGRDHWAIWDYYSDRNEWVRWPTK